MEHVPRVCPIVADVFEWRSGVPQQLRSDGLTVRKGSLDAGDYDLGRGVLVERKTVADLHLSLERGRLWAQVGKLRARAILPYLLVEGGELDDGSISQEGIRGACLAVSGLGIPLVRSSGLRDSAIWLRLLAARFRGTRPGRDRPAYAQRLKPPATLVREAMLAAVPGMSVVRARALLDHFGSIAAVVAADEDDWHDVPGIGPALAARIRSALS